MPEKLLHYLEFGPNTPQEGGISMPECVPAKSFFNSQFQSRWSQILLQDCLSPIRFLSTAMPAGKDPVSRLRYLDRFLHLTNALQTRGWIGTGF